MPYVTTNKDAIDFRVGQQWSHTFLVLVNSAASPITLRRVVPARGVGLGAVARVTTPMAAPSGKNAVTVPEGLYQTYPPVFQALPTASCQVQKLEPLNGFVLQPQQGIRVLTRLRGLRPGLVSYSGYEVYYQAGGQLEREYIPIGYTATVQAGVAPHPLEPWEKGCLSLTHVLPR